MIIMFGFLKKHREQKVNKGYEQPKISSSLAYGLRPTYNNLIDGIKRIFANTNEINPKTLGEIETRLLSSDVGVTVTKQIVSQLKTDLEYQKEVGTEVILGTIKSYLEDILVPCNKSLVIDGNIKPLVILVVGVNGSGKTTTIGKLAKRLRNDNYKIMLAAGDTFRAAAIEQLKIWGERNQIPVILQKPGADSAAVIYDAFQAAKVRNIDVLLADTAGRFHTHHDFMNELKKVKKTIQKIDPTAPHEILLVIDATIGQNSINQVKEFNKIIGITGICITKLDGTAKGGAVFAIAKETKIPIYFIGVGEGIDDLEPFDAKKFVSVLFEE